MDDHQNHHVESSGLVLAQWFFGHVIPGGLVRPGSTTAAYALVLAITTLVFKLAEIA